MNKKAVIVLATGFEEIEAVTVIDILRRANIDITIASLDEIEINVTGSHNITIQTDTALSKIKPDFDMLILPGGMPGALHLANSKPLISLIKKSSEKNILIAAICASPAVVLAPIGILDNKSATCYPGMQNEFNETTKYKDEPVVIDGNIITSQGPATAMEFAFKIVEKLAGLETAKTVRKHALFD